MDRRGLLSTLAVSVSLAGCSDPEPANGTAPRTEEPDDRATIIEDELVRGAVGTDEETVGIEGTVRIEAEGLQHVELQGRFFDAEEELLDTTFERLQELAVGTQPFEIRYPDIGPMARAVDGYEVTITTII
jgi:hypothetical protein